MRFLFILFFFFFCFNHYLFANNSLTEFLVSKPSMPDPRFQESVIVMFYHNSTGATGLVINKPLKNITINELFEVNNIKPPKNLIKKEITLFWGGPVKPEQIFFIHSSDYTNKNNLFSNDNYTVSQSPNILIDIAKNKGPKKYLIFSGISTWSPNQLDSELIRNHWEKRVNNYTSPFDNSKELWKNLLNSKDI
tara:strand:+ start:61 stop:639 length:579 start_codon:yes stop_codon:yes gene_type:complete